MTQEQKEAIAKELFPEIQYSMHESDDDERWQNELGLLNRRFGCKAGLSHRDKEVEELRGVIAELWRLKNQKVRTMAENKAAQVEIEAAWERVKQILSQP